MESFLGHVSLCHPPGIYYKSWGHLNFGSLFEPKRFCQASYIGLALTNPSSWPRSHKGPNKALPHVKCLMEDDIIGDGRLNRSELIAIINIMTGRLGTKSVRSLVVAPVMIFSLMGPEHLRVLEASFNGTNLIVRQMKLYDMTEYDAATVDLLTRWWLGKAEGKITKSILKETSA